ncbi:hypothetical protein H696_00949 [Fonticula alba]|uniref:Uncharacterized protein n=1 Tax=Fonticula alba TaxID=691883 RepID=A0A058ZIR9_FONAL|nr:hypothetical protein H696_00949 [Fonticula alba]KCV73412.1 hypothetical protein H696_00949 [Fonticula alba]|eukprot:XP_009493113.1 hypothetical protein H696_00949 [Fonticula alba]
MSALFARIFGNMINEYMIKRLGESALFKRMAIFTHRNISQVQQKTLDTQRDIQRQIRESGGVSNYSNKVAADAKGGWREFVRVFKEEANRKD